MLIAAVFIDLLDLAFEPILQLVGRLDFWDSDLMLSKDVLKKSDAILRSV